MPRWIEAIGRGGTAREREVTVAEAMHHRQMFAGGLDALADALQLPRLATS